jgi:hypothetical protein
VARRLDVLGDEGAFGSWTFVSSAIQVTGNQTKGGRFFFVFFSKKRTRNSKAEFFLLGFFLRTLDRVQ